LPIPQDVAVKATDLIVMSVALLSGVTAWLWRLTTANKTTAINNETNIKLINQEINNHQGKVNSIEDKVTKLTDEITKMKFSIQELNHKQEINHTELLNEIRSINKQ